MSNSTEVANKTTDKSEVKKAAVNASANATNKVEERVPLAVTPEQGHDVKSTNWNTPACDGTGGSCTSGGYYGLASKKNETGNGQGNSGETHLPTCDGTNTPNYNGTLNCKRDTFVQVKNASTDGASGEGHLPTCDGTNKANYDGSLNCKMDTLAQKDPRFKKASNGYDNATSTLPICNGYNAGPMPGAPDCEIHTLS